MKIKVRYLAATLPALCALFAGAALAQDSCAQPDTQAEMNACAHKSYTEADEKLNEVYKRVQERLPDDERVSLRDAQRLWLKYRDTTCRFEGQRFEGGSIQPLIISSCLETETRARTAALERLLQD